MSTEPTVIAKRHATAKQHLAGLAGARAWIQDLSAAHLLSYQHPIRDEPLPDASHDEPA